MRSRKSLIKEADRVFSLFVRNRGATFGYNHCFTCLKYLPIEELQAGHFINRRYLSVRWHPMNVWPQCNTCNVVKGGNLERYESKLIAFYTELAVQGLWELALTGDLTDYEINDLIKKYK